MLPDDLVIAIEKNIPKGASAVQEWMPWYLILREEPFFTVDYGPRILNAWLAEEEKKERETCFDIIEAACPNFVNDLEQCGMVTGRPGIIEIVYYHMDEGQIQKVIPWFYIHDVQKALIAEKLLFPCVFNPHEHPEWANHQQKLLGTYNENSVFNKLYDIPTVALEPLIQHWSETYTIDPAHKILWATVARPSENPNIILQQYLEKYGTENGSLPLFLSLLEIPERYPGVVWTFDDTTQTGQFLHSIYTHYTFFGKGDAWSSILDDYFEHDENYAMQEWLHKHPYIPSIHTSEIAIFS